MSLLILAQAPDLADGEFLTLCHRWGDVASVIGFALALLSMAITLIGFFLTLRGQRRIRAAAEAATRRAAYQIAAAEVGTLLRLVEGMREAVRQRHWLAVILRGSEAWLIAHSLAYSRTLTELERRALQDLAEKLRRAIQYIEQRLAPTDSPEELSPRHRRELDRSLQKLAELRGRLQHELTEE